MPLLLLLFLATPFSAAPSPADVLRLQSARNVGLAALEEGNLADASRRFETVRRLAPSEPLGWADGAVVAMRGKDLEAARRLLAEALRLSPADPRLLALEGTRRELTGDTAGAIEFFEKAAGTSPKDLASRWSAARLLSERGEEGRRRAITDLEAALKEAPANLFLFVRLSELLRAEGDRVGAAAVHERLAALVAGDARLDAALVDAKRASEGADPRAASLKYKIVENLLRATQRFQQARHDVEPGVVGLPLEEWSPPLDAAVRARAGSAVSVTFAPVPDASLKKVTGASAVRVAGKDARDLVFAGESDLRVAAASARGGYRTTAPIPGSASGDVAVADLTNSGELDLATPGTLWVKEAQTYRKVPIASGERVIPLDFDSDGDLDLYISSRSGDHLLRNNLDGTWTDATAASGLPARVASRGAVAADFDRDGDIDLLILREEGGFALFDNLRGGRLAERDAGLPRTGNIRAAAAGDLNGDGRVDLVWTNEEGGFVALNRGDGTFLAAKHVGPGAIPLLFDYDNDGLLDLFLANPVGPSALFRNAGDGSFSPSKVGRFPPARDAEAVDFDSDGDLDLVLVTPEGGASLLENRGGNANGWIDVALEGLPTGSAKVNRFGYGSEVEAKAQDLYVYRTVSRPITRLGLGSRRRADVLRIVWTNGVPQNALDPPARTVVREVQQLKGSCPFLYAFDGNRWHFVTDVLGRSPAGLLFDGVHQAAADTREWLIISGSPLQPVRGRLTLDFTEELWETAYFDLAELFAVDHPADVAIVSNEKMVPPPFPPKRLFTVSHPRTPKAVDGGGRDRTAEIDAEDGVFLGGFAATRYQGIVAPHELILELPEARGAKSVMLYLTGWIFYADTSIAVALSQRADLKTFGPVLEVPDGRGGWKTAIPAMGYPAGKTKTMPVDLSDVLDRSDPRVRVRTNLAIYWDRIAYTTDEARASLTITPLPLVSADLFFRGFSAMTRPFPEGPQIFVHDDVARDPRWADMAGLYTRFGDVRELLLAADDRYVVMKGGDAARLNFDAAALPPLPAGWSRDYLAVLDGWDKDADKNTVAGQTVEPLPFHGMDDARYGEILFPESEAHREFLRRYLTRRGGPGEFLDAVRDGRREAGNGRRQ
ncbi:MAG TPA: FG-GAP-like repeat-containing protein [Thermoanaerobaculia bacterium]